MQPRQWDEVKSLFLEATERPPADRHAFVEDACAGDDELKAEVLKLLAQHDDDATAEIASRRHTYALAVGELLASRFKIVKLIGRGGMGEVYLAEDLDLGGSEADRILHRNPLIPEAVRFKDLIAGEPQYCTLLELKQRLGSRFAALSRHTLRPSSRQSDEFLQRWLEQIMVVLAIDVARTTAYSIGLIKHGVREPRCLSGR